MARPQGSPLLSDEAVWLIVCNPGMTAPALARRLGVSESAVRTRRATLRERVQNLLDSRTQTGSRPLHPEHGLLRSIARCGVCRRSLTLKTRGTGQKYLACTRGSGERKACGKPSPSIKLEWLEEPVWAKVRELLLDPYKLWDKFESSDQQQAERIALAGVEGRLEEVNRRRARLLRSLELLDDADLGDVRERLAELAAEREALVRRAGLLRGQLQGRESGRERLERLLEWSLREAGRVDELTVEEKHAILLDLGVRVYVYPSTAEERYHVNVERDDRPGEADFWEGIDWSAVEEPTPEQIRETARIQAEEGERGFEADLGGAVTGSRDGQYRWDYWDEHFLEAIAQHARVLGLTRKAWTRFLVGPSGICLT